MSPRTVPATALTPHGYSAGAAPLSRAVLLLLVSALLGSAVGCGVAPQLMPTPNLYADGDVDPFPDVPPALRNNRVGVLYFTDRSAADTPEESTKGKAEYGFHRSRSVAFGVSVVEFGKDVSWDDLNAASRTRRRKVSLPISVRSTTQLVRLPQTPRTIVAMPTTAPEVVPPGVHPMLGDEFDAEQLEAETAIRREIAARLAVTPSKEVYLFIHGYNNNFDDSVLTIAQLWHFFGRQGVPVAYSWPAGRSGLLRGYTYDRESSEFTVYHLKQMIRLIASCPEVQKIHIISHSRGTDTTLNAIRELHMEISGSGRSTRDVLKLGTLVMAAPDIDLDVVIQKLSSVHFGTVPERFALYVNSDDRALNISRWLVDGVSRLGGIQASIFAPTELAALRSSKSVEIIEARVSDTGAFGHDYFHSNPAVSSDLVLLLRYQLHAGEESGRPLAVEKSGFWAIKDGYPGKYKLPTTQPTTRPPEPVPEQR